MLDATMPTGAPEGGSIPLITALPDSFSKKSPDHKITVLEGIAYEKGYRTVWDKIVTPWLSQQPVNVVKAGLASEPPAAASSSASSSGQPLPPGDPPIEAPVPIPVPDAPEPLPKRKTLQDLVKSNLATNGKN